MLVKPNTVHNVKLEIGHTMNKTELISKVAEKSGLSKKDSEKAVNAFIETVTEALKSGNDVQLIGFGNFQVKQRAAR
ncbi:HU family DNA-binding protein, partial [Arsenophonus nasoniae]|uniref:HU family DNA-binding protein n=1 Tax=Arsenophonus nasoniae TaxID=638 RepID=UPI0038796516